MFFSYLLVYYTRAIMNNYNDFHQISDISSISACSQSGNRFIGRMDFTQSLFDNYSGVAKNSNKFASGQEVNLNEKLMNSLVLCEKNISERIKANIVYECIKEASLNHKNILCKNTVDKLTNLLLLDKLDKYMRLPSLIKHVQDEMRLLGISDLPPSDLIADEKLDVKCCVETLLRERIHDMILKYEALGENVQEISKTNEYNICSKLEYSDTPVAQWKNKIEELILQYESDLSRYTDLINQWTKLKYEDMSQMQLEKTGYLHLQANVAELQAKITRLSCAIRMFKETPITLDAFKRLDQLVEDKLKAVADELKQKEDLKKLYDNLKNTEYDQVLEVYLQLCNAIKKKKRLFDMLK